MAKVATTPTKDLMQIALNKFVKLALILGEQEADRNGGKWYGPGGTVSFENTI